MVETKSLHTLVWATTVVMNNWKESEIWQVNHSTISTVFCAKTQAYITCPVLEMGDWANLCFEWVCVYHTVWCERFCLDIKLCNRVTVTKPIDGLEFEPYGLWPRSPFLLFKRRLNWRGSLLNLMSLHTKFKVIDIYTHNGEQGDTSCRQSCHRRKTITI